MTARRIKDIIARQTLLTIAPTETTRDAARQMIARNVAAVLVIDAGGRLLGIFTERDLLRRVVAEGRDPDRTAVAQVMTEKPNVIAPDATALDAMRIMESRHVRHLPVVKDGRAIGIVSIRDFLGAELDEVRRERERRDHLWES
ncbi:MAG: CBS domain-containing protein [Alphaproteobacteria bacterium]|nr:CBS domain-containing protein [Alphaproteobacteria bacterium]